LYRVAGPGRISFAFDRVLYDGSSWVCSAVRWYGAECCIASLRISNSECSETGVWNCFSLDYVANCHASSSMCLGSSLHHVLGARATREFHVLLRGRQHCVDEKKAISFIRGHTRGSGRFTLLQRKLKLASRWYIIDKEIRNVSAGFPKAW
jgi:hypothetical protein